MTPRDSSWKDSNGTPIASRKVLIVNPHIRSPHGFLIRPPSEGSRGKLLLGLKKFHKSWQQEQFERFLEIFKVFLEVFQKIFGGISRY